jgi:protein-tyrosine phosphatase
MNTKDMDKPIANSYWVQQGHLLAGEYPGARDEAGARLKLSLFVSAGITAFIDLTEEGELGPYSGLLPNAIESDGDSITYDRMPIKDLGVPTSPAMSKILERVNILLKNGVVVYVHCWGGIGRTGTVIGCYMVQEMGMSGSEALMRIEELRNGVPDTSRRSPETEEQRDMVLKWGSAL